ncbi:hypothetical protein [Ferrimicrobium sp.]|uniref:hypothetical protein n=1 Tax=Ferrimicrobium sp. TaxID=2926050 RepID=UPI002634E4BF|nr:hypothetical protein [Ferrimicrobium sp.]
MKPLYANWCAGDSIANSYYGTQLHLAKSAARTPLLRGCRGSEQESPLHSSIIA